MFSKAEFPPLPGRTQRGLKSSLKTPRRSEASRSAKEQQRSVTSLNDLPDELIVEILDYLPGIDLQHFQLLTLANLSLTNRRLNRIVSERLYATFDSFFCTPYPFVRTVSSNTGLASQVKSVSFRYGPNAHENRPLYSPSISDKQKIKDGLKRLNIPDWKNFASCCNEAGAEQEHIYATLLLYTPNVSTLSIDDGALEYKIPDWLKILRHIVSGQGFGRGHRFEHLQSLRIDLQYLKLRHLAPILKLQSMRKVTLIGLVEWGNGKEDKPESLRRLLPAGSSRVEDLCLQESYLCAEVFGVLVSSIKKLRSFQYRSTDARFVVNGHGSADYWGDSDKQGFERYDEDDARNCYGKMLDSLRRHGRSLETLCLRDDLSIPRQENHAYDLSSFERLVHIEVPAFVLVEKVSRPGTDNMAKKLPPRIQCLTMTVERTERYGGHVNSAVVAYLECAPSLSKLKIIHDLFTNGACDCHRIQILCLEKGIVLEHETDWGSEVEDGSNGWMSERNSPDESDSSTSDAESLYSD